MMTAPCAAMKGRVRHQRIASWDGVSPAPSAIALYASAACRARERGGGTPSYSPRHLTAASIWLSSSCWK